MTINQTTEELVTYYVLEQLKQSGYYLLCDLGNNNCLVKHKQVLKILVDEYQNLYHNNFNNMSAPINVHDLHFKDNYKARLKKHLRIKYHGEESLECLF